MPACWIQQNVRLRGHPDLIRTYQAAILLREGDRYTVMLPETDNELIKGATRGFIKTLVRKQMLVIQVERPNK